MRENRGVAAADRFMAAQTLVPDGKAYMKELPSGYLSG